MNQTTKLQAISAKDIVMDGVILRDQAKRQRLFNGLCLIDKGRKNPEGPGHLFIPDHWPADLMEQLAARGINLIRLGMIWAGLEPEPGKYDERYIQFLEEQLDKAADLGIAVILDMHQDLYAQRFSDGAPDWAVLTQHTFEDTELWSDAYITSRAVQESWDAFWRNDVAPTSGKGLQDHYAELWAYLAARFKDHPAILAYDIMNEPAPGSEMPDLFTQLLQGFMENVSPEQAEALHLADLPSPEAIFFDPELKLQFLELLKDEDFFRKISDNAAEGVARLEQEKIGPFFDRVARTIRQVDSETLLFRSHNYLSNIAVPPGLEPIKVDGEVDPRQVFTPHGYDLLVDTEAYAHASDERARFIFKRHRETQERLNVPVIVGEWGALSGFENAYTHMPAILERFESYGWSATYWCWEDDFLEKPASRVLDRDYPVAIQGTLQAIDRAEGFCVTWEENRGEGMSLFRLKTKPSSILLDGEALTNIAEHLVEADGESYLLQIPASGKARVLEVYR